MNHEKAGQQHIKEIDRYVQLANQALDKNDLRGANEQARFAARELGKLAAHNRLCKRDLPVARRDKKIRHLFTAINDKIQEHTRNNK